MSESPRCASLDVIWLLKVSLYKHFRYGYIELWHTLWIIKG
jgi:hypothetical protein